MPGWAYILAMFVVALLRSRAETRELARELGQLFDTLRREKRDATTEELITWLGRGETAAAQLAMLDDDL